MLCHPGRVIAISNNKGGQGDTYKKIDCDKGRRKKIPPRPALNVSNIVGSWKSTPRTYSWKIGGNRFDVRKIDVSSTSI